MFLSSTLKMYFAGAGIAIGAVGYVKYVADTLKGKTKPHAFSWLIWAILTGICFAGQVSENAGAGSWVTGFGAIACTVIFCLALFKGERDITRGDYWCLFFSLAAIPLWLLTETPLWSMIQISIIDIVGFVPTYRKSYARPDEETLFAFVGNIIKFALSLLALETFSVVTVIYPLTLVVSNSVFVAMVLFRRKVLQRNH